MNKLVFKAAEVTRVVEHTVKTEGQILLVHDHGIYLMSNGEPRDMFNETSNYVAYAQGCDPELDPDWYETARDLVGGDDFGEALPFALAIKEQIDNGAEEIVLIITANAIKLAKPKVATIRKCSKCDRLLKKQEVGDVCPKCQEQDTSPSTEILNLLQVGQASNNKEITTVEEGQQVLSDDATPPHNGKTESKIQETTIKPGQAIRDKFNNLVNEGKITEEVLIILLDTEQTKQVLGIRYAFLKEFNPEVPIKELTYVNKAARYSSKPIKINGKQYIMTNDLYAKSLPKFMEWADAISK